MLADSTLRLVRANIDPSCTLHSPFRLCSPASEGTGLSAHPWKCLSCFGHMSDWTMWKDQGPRLSKRLISRGSGYFSSQHEYNFLGAFSDPHYSKLFPSTMKSRALGSGFRSCSATPLSASLRQVTPSL